MDIYERYGRLVEKHEIECEAHRQTIRVLRALKRGELSIDSVDVTDDNQWAIQEDVIADAAPAS